MKKEKLTPLEKEWGKVVNQELAFLSKRAEKTDSRLNQMLEKRMPAGLQNTLDTAFGKAFRLVFEKGTGVIEKTYNKDEMKKIDDMLKGFLKVTNSLFTIIFLLF